MIRLVAALAAALAFAVPSRAQESPKFLRIGIIGCDTSHAGVFANTFNDPKAAGDPDLAGFKVVAAFPGGSPDLPISKNRVEKFTEALRAKGIEIVDSIEKLLEKVDVILLLSVDGRVHLKQAELVLKSGKRVFIDKPFAATLTDAIAIVELSKLNKTPILSCSSLRWSKALTELTTDPKVGGVLGCVVWGDCALAEHHPDLAFYGIHGIEMMFGIMGPGCKSVARTNTPDCDSITCVWNDGRVATYRGPRTGKGRDFAAVVFGKNGNAPSLTSEGYRPMLKEIGRFFRTGEAPLTAQQMLETIAVIEAADISKTRGGAVVELADVMSSARSKLNP